MACDQFLELLSARLDGALTEEEERELEEHLAVCPDCRAVGAQLTALQGAFLELEEDAPPEGFARGVMDRIREEARPKVIPLFQRPQVRALAGLAACLVVVVGLYGASRPRYLDETVKMDVTVRSFNQDALTQETDSAASLEEVPQIAAYAAPEAQGLEKAATDADFAVPQSCAFQNDQYIWVSYGYTPEPGARIIGSGQSLENFLAGFSGGNFSEVQARYDEGYFETGRLLAVVVEEPSGSIEHRISELLRDQVVIEQTSPPCTCDMAAWLILAEVDTMFNDGDQLELTVIPCADDAGESGLTVIHEEDSSEY